MNPTDYEKYMRAFENSNDPRIHPSMNVVVRLDGRNFSKLTRKTLQLDPFDKTMRDSMVTTVAHLMEFSGFRIQKGFTQSDEISLVLDPVEIHRTFNGKIRKILSLLAAQASVVFTNKMKAYGLFDARVIQLPTKETVADYFRWRQADSETNCINQWCYFYLTRTDEHSPYAAQQILNGKQTDWKNEYLYSKGVNYNDLPQWQKQGIVVKWESYQKEGFNPITKEKVMVDKLRLTTSLADEGDKITINN